MSSWLKNGHTRMRTTIFLEDTPTEQGAFLSSYKLVISAQGPGPVMSFCVSTPSQADPEISLILSRTYTEQGGENHEVHTAL